MWNPIQAAMPTLVRPYWWVSPIKNGNTGIREYDSLRPEGKHKNFEIRSDTALDLWLKYSIQKEMVQGQRAHRGRKEKPLPLLYVQNLVLNKQTLDLYPSL